jgi:hypothetical protein
MDRVCLPLHRRRLSPFLERETIGAIGAMGDTAKTFVAELELNRLPYGL